MSERSSSRFFLLAFVTAVAIILVLKVRLGTLEWQASFPAMALREPTRDLFVFVERERRVAQARTWHWLPSQGCAACTEEAAAQRFDELFHEQRRYVAARYRRHRGAAWLKEARAARVVALAGWGNPGRLSELKTLPRDELPDYLAERAVEIAQGDSSREEERIARVGLAQEVLWTVSAALAALGAGVGVAWLRGYRYPRRQRRSVLSAPTLGRGLLVFVWAQAFVAACTRLRQEFPDTPFELFGLLPGLALAIGTVALLYGTKVRAQEKPVGELLRCPPDRRSRRALWWFATGLLGGMTVFHFALTSIAVRFGFGPHWTEGFSEKLSAGTSVETSLRVVGYLVLLPFAEELAYRGVLFGALATRVRPHRAALISSLCFALMTGFGLVGFCSVLLGGYLRARLSARTGTLLPAMLMHAMNNVLLVAWVLTTR